MPRTKDPPKPLYPLKHEFAASLDAYTHQARMLADAVRTMLKAAPAALPEGVRALLQERLDAFERASSGEE